MQENDTRPFRILGVQQIAIGAKLREALRPLWVDMMGAVPTGSFSSEKENVDEEIVRLGEGELAFELDLMQPLDPDRKPRVDSPALNHFGLWVDDLDSAATWLEGKGVRMAPGGIRKGASGHNVCFIHPKANADFPVAGEGVLIELVQAPAELIAKLLPPAND